MSQNLQHKIFADTEHLSEETLKRYNTGTMSASEKHKTESHMLDCELCSEAQEGFALFPSASTGKEWKQQVIEKTFNKGNVFRLNTLLMWAAVFVAIISVGVYWFVETKQTGNSLAENTLPKQDEQQAETGSDKDILQKEEELQEDENMIPVAEEKKSERISADVPDKSNIETIIAEDREQAPLQKNADMSFADETKADADYRQPTAGNTEKEETIADDILSENTAKKSAAKNNRAEGAAVLQTTQATTKPEGGKKLERKIPVSGTDYKVAEYELADVTIQQEERQHKVAEVQSKSISPKYANAEEEKAKKQEEAALIMNMTYDEMLKSGIELYHKSKYTESLEQFSLLLKAYPKDLNASFYSGLCYFFLESYKDAIKKFEIAINASQSTFKEEAEWYKALSLKKSGDGAQARKLLQKISSDNGFYSGWAKEELKK
jgi:hypothetical protein